MRGLLSGWTLVILVLTGALSPALAEITFTGDTYDSGSYFTAGANTNRTGGLQIDAGSVFSRSSGYLGQAVGSTGTATITGNGSKWISSVQLITGFRGSGALTVQAGGEVSGDMGDLGWKPGATGTAIITGTGSHWTNRSLRVGLSGSGTMKVENGGSVSSSRLAVGFGDGSSGTLRVEAGGQVSSTFADLARIPTAPH